MRAVFTPLSRFVAARSAPSPRAVLLPRSHGSESAYTRTGALRRLLKHTRSSGGRRAARARLAHAGPARARRRATRSKPPVRARTAAAAVPPRPHDSMPPHRRRAPKRAQRRAHGGYGALGQSRAPLDARDARYDTGMIQK